MKISNRKNLDQLNTMSLNVSTERFVEISDVEEVFEVIKLIDLQEEKYFILGEGSNTIFNGNYKGIVILNRIKGIEKISEDEDTITFKVGGGENWDKFVRYVSELELSGVENLAFIPGTVGAAPVQNIAAYGQQISDGLVEVNAIDLFTGKKKKFSKNECDLRYRYSIFKESDMKKYFITDVVLKLSKVPKFDTEYHSRFPNESLQKWLKEEAEPPYKPIDIVNAVTQLRKYKLPLVEEYGTCGSAFVNPFVTVHKYNELAKIIPDLQSYPTTSMDYSRKEWGELEDEELVKIPAGRLLDELGWKGKWIGNVGTFDKHALCVVTNKEASPGELLEYMDQMAKNVREEYGVDLKSEIVIV